MILRLDVFVAVMKYFMEMNDFNASKSDLNSGQMLLPTEPLALEQSTSFDSQAGSFCCCTVKY